MDDYVRGDDVTYVISIANSSGTAFTGLTVTDDLGKYTLGALTLYPLEYVTGSIRYYQNGVLQAAPTVVAGPPLVISGITVPANGNAMLIYESQTNEFAPLGVGDVINNEAIISGGGLSTPVSAKETITTEEIPNLAITKCLSPNPIVENGILTYTFTIENFGNTAASAADNVKITDTFNPAITSIGVKFNGASWSDPTEYSYVEATGVFATVPGKITVPPATFTRTASGAVIVTPGVSTLIVTGTV